MNNPSLKERVALINWKNLCEPVGKLLFSQSRRTSLLLGFFFLALIGFFDYLTGYGILVSVFYLVPVSVYSWSVGTTAGMVMAVISEMTETVANLTAGSHGGSFYSTGVFVASWNMAVKTLFFLVFAYAVSKLKEGYEEQKRLNQELQLHTKELEAAYKSLESFTYAASHDLRSPLITIDGFSKILSEDYGGKLDDNGIDLLNRIRVSVKKMVQMIEDLLSFSRVTSRELLKGDIEMEALAKEVLEELSPAFEGREIQMSLKTLPPAYGDASMIRQVFVNLVSNAVKFTRTKDKALIEIRGYSEEGNNIYCISDNGIGFDMDSGTRLFNLFKKIHGSPQFEGTGIGLVIVKTIIEKHGGKVWAEGAPGKGATFFFTLPGRDS